SCLPSPTLSTIFSSFGSAILFLMANCWASFGVTSCSYFCFMRGGMILFPTGRARGRRSAQTFRVLTGLLQFRPELLAVAGRDPHLAAVLARLEPDAGGLAVG